MAVLLTYSILQSPLPLSPIHYLLLLCHLVDGLQEDAEPLQDGDGDDVMDVVLHERAGGATRTEEDGEADDEFEALLSRTMSESVEKSKLARATTQVKLRLTSSTGVCCCILHESSTRGLLCETTLTVGFVDDLALLGVMSTDGFNGMDLCKALSTNGLRWSG